MAKDFGSIKTKLDLDTRGSLDDEDLLNAPVKRRKKIDPETRQKVSFLFDKALWKDLKRFAIDQETTIKAIIDKVVREWVDKQEK